MQGRAKERQRRRRNLAIVLACLSLSAAIGPFGSREAVARSYPALFNTREVRSTNLEPFTKWRGAMARNLEEARVPDDCEPGLFTRCDAKEWRSFLDEIAGLERREQLDAVNREMNRRSYILDPRNWGVPDYWATPRQFFRKHGDCEDYAIAKYLSLRALGVPTEDMRIVVLQDLNLGIPHAVLVVYLGEEAFVLDNQIRQVISAKQVYHYKPVYSINETAWWLHR